MVGVLPVFSHSGMYIKEPVVPFFESNIAQVDVGTKTSFLSIVGSEPLQSSKNGGSPSGDEGKEQQRRYPIIQWMLIHVASILAMGMGIYLAVLLAPKKGFYWFPVGCLAIAVGWFGYVFIG